MNCEQKKNYQLTRWSTELNTPQKELVHNLNYDKMRCKMVQIKDLSHTALNLFSSQRMHILK